LDAWREGFDCCVLPPARLAIRTGPVSPIACQEARAHLRTEVPLRTLT
jgi:hypothetical protein